MKNLRWFLALACGLPLLSSSCAHYVVNPPLDSSAAGPTYHFQDLSRETNSDELFVLLCFSGGGMRATALSYGVLEALARTSIVWEGQRRRLLDEVDLISSVSGGSFTSAYYCLHGDGIFKDFEEKFLKVNLQNKLLARTLIPWNWPRLASRTFNNSDMAMEYYDRHLFQGATFGELGRRNLKPFLIINATDISMGTPFSFNQSFFELICSDLMRFPISRAVAASSAFPSLLNPVTLKNYAGRCEPAEMPWLRDKPLAAHSQVRWRLKQQEVATYLDSTNRPYIHLIDGGIADNLGLRPPAEALVSRGGLIHAIQTLRNRTVRKLAVIVVNAEVEPDKGWNRREQPPNLFNTIMAASTTPVRRSSLDSLEIFKTNVREWEAEARRQPGPDGAPGGFDFYMVEVAFELLADPKEREYLNHLPTRLNLKDDAVDKVRAVAGRLLDESEDYRRLLRDLGTQPNPPPAGGGSGRAQGSRSR